MSGGGRLTLVEGGAGEHGILVRAADAIGRAQTHLLAQQDARGYWAAPLEANATMEAEYVFANRILGRHASDTERRLTDRLLALQHADGGWPLYPGGPGHLSITIETYLALKLCGLSPDEPALVRARELILAGGGLAAAGVFTRIWLALFGQFPWHGVPAMPVELVLLPPWFPLNIYAMSSWARSTVVPLTLLMARRPEFHIPAEASVGELWRRPPAQEDVGFHRSPELVTWRNFFLAVDRALKLLGGATSWRPLRRRAVARAIEWLLRHQDTNGQWGGIQPAMINSTLALSAVGFANDHPVIQRAVQGVDEFLIECEGTLMYQPCVSPNWDTALAARALLDAGMDPSHPALGRAGEWLVAKQIFRPGDWSVYNPALEPAGWAFEFANDWFPDVDDSAVILTVLEELPLSRMADGKRAIARGLHWVLGMQSWNGGWGAFDTNNDAAFLNRIPFADMEAMIDPPTEDLTGRLLWLMGSAGYGLDFRRAKRAVEYLRRTQRADGSWWGRWGCNFVYGTWCALAGLERIGEDMSAPWIRRAVEWLVARQNLDGGWGETLESYVDESRAGRGDSTASQTAWAVLGLLAGDGPHGHAVTRGIDWLVRAQTADGTWSEQAFTGTGFPGHFYLRYHLYRHYFPLMALGQFRARRAAAAAGQG